MNGNLILLLHAHLPYVRHPEHEYSLEENWFFEAVRETYIPLLDAFEGMVNDGISPKITMSVSPTLTEMLYDELLRHRFVRHMEHLIELSEAEKIRTKGSPFESSAFLYNAKFKRIRQLYLERYNGNLVSAFRKLQDDGHIEVVATAATHAFLPAFEHYPAAVKAQIDVGIKSYIRSFGRRPLGFWLPECGYFRGLDFFLRDAGMKYFFLESHGVIHGRPRPRHSVYRSVLTPSGIAAFGRDFKSARQVWCASRGYPGDPSYRDFYRDIGFDLPLDYVGSYTGLEGIKTFTGMKYHCVTGKSEQKLPYNRANALRKVLEHAAHFVQEREYDLARLSGFGHFSKSGGPVVFSAFDAELFGHWWFEGIEWLNITIRNISEHRASFRVVTPVEYFDEHSADYMDSIEPSPSSWGEGGYNAMWIGERNHRLYRRLHATVERMTLLKQRIGETENRRERGKNTDSPIHPFTHSLIQRAINQAMRETFLSQASDWLFLMQKGRAAEYAEERIMRHIERFDMLFSMVMNRDVNESRLKEMEESDNIFRRLDILKDN
ncbi:MAG: DUF1957 domain-containing protein [Nitrospirae bacterium]|nr:DUF1957 domain-containing protein [Nitrospirota bacterium]